VIDSVLRFHISIEHAKHAEYTLKEYFSLRTTLSFDLASLISNFSLANILGRDVWTSVDTMMEGYTFSFQIDQDDISSELYRTRPYRVNRRARSTVT
jgi:hypothetical protein